MCTRVDFYICLDSRDVDISRTPLHAPVAAVDDSPSHGQTLTQTDLLSLVSTSGKESSLPCPFRHCDSKASHLQQVSSPPLPATVNLRTQNTLPGPAGPWGSKNTKVCPNRYKVGAAPVYIWSGPHQHTQGRGRHHKYKVWAARPRGAAPLQN